MCIGRLFTAWKENHISVVWNWYHFVAIAIFEYAIATQWYQFHTTDAFSLIVIVGTVTEINIPEEQGHCHVCFCGLITVTS